MTQSRKTGAITVIPPPNQGSSGKGRKWQGLPIFFPDEDEVDEYSDDVPSASIVAGGVKVPRTRQFGGTPKAGPFGRVVQGSIITADGNQGPTDLSNITGIDAELPEEPEKLSLDDIMDGMEKDISQQIAELPQPRKKRKRRRKNTAEKPAQHAAPVSDSVQNRKNFTLEGFFGTFRGRCHAIEITQKFVVIQYSSVDIGFSPPAGEDPITLVCEGEEYIVFFVGCEFPLSEHNLFVQVYIRGSSDQQNE